MFKFRIISFPLLLALFGYIIFGGKIGEMIFNIIAPVMICLAAYEFLSMLQNAGVKSFPTLGGLFALFIAIDTTFELGGVSAIIGVGVSFCFFLSLLFVKEEQRLEYIGKGIVSFGGVFILLTGFMPLIFIYQEEAINLLFLVLTTKMMDTGGYIFGMLSHKLLPNGNHKILPAISPKKSYEGTFGGIFLSILTGFILFKLNYSPFASLAVTLLVSAIFAVGSFAGDLTESAIKRCCKVKDSGDIIPGMGGVFDVLDSFIYNGIIFGIISKFLG